MKKKTAFLLGAIIILGHSTATMLYLLPKNPLTKKYSTQINSYMNPVFTQNWGLFAPAPAKSSVRLWFRCQENKLDWSNWLDPTSNLIVRHQKNRLSPYRKLIYINSYLARSLNNYFVAEKSKIKCSLGHSDCSNNLYKKVSKSSYYKVVHKLVEDLCIVKSKRSSAVQFLIVNIHVKNFSDRYLKKKGKLNSLYFPMIEIDRKI